MRLGIPKESYLGERRVAATPDTVTKLKNLGFEVAIEAGAGAGASFSDEAYAAAGAEIVDAARVFGESDVVIKLRAPTMAEADRIREGTTLISFIWKVVNEELVAKLASRKLNVLAMEMIPRTTRAQKMDALSSTANLVGYRAVVEAAANFGSFFTQQITAAGKFPPAKVLIIGAGVAGLAAMGTARGLGAVVRAFDTRSAAREQVQSMGCEFLEVQLAEDGDGGGGYAKEMSPAFIEAEMALFAKQAAEVDIVITTALIPNRPAPKLWLASHVAAMKAGSVIIDLAAEQGGNCDLTKKDELTISPNGVKIVGWTDYPSRLATTASQLYGMNLVHLLTDLGGAAKWNINLEDEILRGASLIHAGEVLPPAPPVNPSPAAKPAAAAPAAPAPVAAAPVAAAAPSAPKKSHGGHGGAAASGESSGFMKWMGIALLIGWLALRFTSGAAGESAGGATAFLQHLTVFVLACFVGWQVVWNVTPALHTPLMSVTNAISGIILLGGMLHEKSTDAPSAMILGTVAILLATINIAGGFLVTQRMLKMFRK